MRYLHTMVRVENVDESMKFYCDLLGMKETRRIESEQGSFTLIYLAPPADVESAKSVKAPELELT
ncbi:VOC family protein, partial [Thalassospira sp. UBA1131]|uniref:VOC family protein n=1 Tax=Thalassospira sp. UBA1131 TaxID=1947672 RepID=UPI0025D5CA65